MPKLPQNYANHVRIVPLYLGALGILTINLARAGWRAAQAPSVDTVMAAATACALVAIALYARGFALTVQDRVIRLEMRLRLRARLPESQRASIDRFTKNQLVALRFASDAELPQLAETVLRDNIQDRKTIKQMVQHWRADDFRV